MAENFVFFIVYLTGSSPLTRKELFPDMVFAGLFIDQLCGHTLTTDDFPLAEEYNIGRKGGL